MAFISNIMKMLMILFFVIATASATGCPQRCKCFDKVKTVDCKKAGLSKIPSAFPPDTTKIDLSLNHIEQVGDKAFASAPLVNFIDLRHNKIEKLGGLAFSGVPELQIIYLNKNALRNSADLTSLTGLAQLTELHLSFNQFTSIPNIQSDSLQKLVMDGNRIQSANFPDSFRLCTSLQSVVLSNNKIGSISSRDFSNLASSIKSINLNSNKIKEIDPAALEHVSENLETLTLDSNKLNGAGVADALKGLSKTGSPALLTLSLKRNQITQIDSKLFQSLDNGVLRNLQLDFNTIRSFDSVGFSYFSQSIKLLSMIHCGLSKFDVDMSQFTSLTNLALDKNHLTTLPGYLPSSLQQLTASNNKITKWPSTTFSELGSLKHLDLSSNQIQTVDHPGFNTSLGIALNTVKQVNLDKNPFKCDCDLTKFITWAKKNTKKITNWSKYRCSSPSKERGVSLAKFDVSGCAKAGKIEL